MTIHCSPVDNCSEGSSIENLQDVAMVQAEDNMVGVLGVYCSMSYVSHLLSGLFQCHITLSC